MKRAKSVLALFLTIIMVVSGSGVVLASGDDRFIEPFIQNQERALEIVMQYNDSRPQDRMGNIIYPAYYGGKYIDGDGNLVFLVVASMGEMAMGHNSSFAPLFGEVSFRYVEFSFAEIREAYERLIHVIDERMGSCIYADNVLGFGIGTRENRMIVELEVYNDDMIMGFREVVLDLPVIAFEQSLVPLRVTLPGQPSFAQVTMNILLVIISVILFILPVAFLVHTLITRRRG